MSYTVNAPLVIADNIDGEVIILNMDSGKYYSTQGSGAAIWQLLSGGVEAIDAATILANHYGAGEPQITAAVTELQEFFITENLLKPFEGSATPTDAGLAVLAGEEFQHPVISSHTDMQGLLLLDPIHEVEDMGWPHKQVDG